MTALWEIDPYWPRDGGLEQKENNVVGRVKQDFRNPDMDFRFQRAEAKENAMVDIKVEKTFSFSQDNVLDLIVDYLAREHQVNVTKDQLRVTIDDSTTGGYMDGQYIPAKISSISVVVPASGK